MKQTNSQSMEPIQSPPRHVDSSPVKSKRGRPTKERIQAEIDETIRLKRGRPPRKNSYPSDANPLNTSVASKEENDPAQSEVLNLSDLFICSECEAMFRSEDLLRGHIHLHRLLETLLNSDGADRGQQHADHMYYQTSSSIPEIVVKPTESCNAIGQCYLGVACNSSHVKILDHNEDQSNTSDVKLEETPADPHELFVDVGTAAIYRDCLDGYQITDESYTELNDSSTMPAELTCDAEPFDGKTFQSRLSRKRYDEFDVKIKNKKIKKLKWAVSDQVEKIDKKWAAIVKIDGIDKFACPDCDRTFSQLPHLNVHRRVHTGERPFMCHRCNYGFNVRCNLMVHLKKNVCVRRLNLDCDGNPLIKAEEGGVPKSEGDENYLGGGAGEGLGNNTEIDDNNDGEDNHHDDDNNHGEDDDGDADYHVGDDDFKSVRRGRKKNRSKKASKRKSSVETMPDIKVLNVGESRYPNLRNIVPAIVVNKRIKLEKVKLVHAILKVKPEPEVVESPHSAATGTPKKYPCEHCGRMFLCLAHVKIHERVHTGDRPYVCVICTRAFSVASNLRTHMRAKHPGVTLPARFKKSTIKQEFDVEAKACDITHLADKPTSNSIESKDAKKNYVCYICHAKFLHPESVVRHFARHLEAPSPRIAYVCGVCDQTCASKANLDTHTRTHTGERPFTCDVCGRSFAQSSHITSHLRTHDDASAHRDFVCDLCGASYKRNYALKRHQRSSHPTDGTVLCCEICECVVGSKFGLTKHMNIVHAARPYVCLLCGRGYDTAMKLAEHKLRHSVPKGYACSLCDKRYAFPGDLRKHCRMIHAFGEMSAPSEENVA